MPAFYPEERGIIRLHEGMEHEPATVRVATTARTPIQMATSTTPIITTTYSGAAAATPIRMVTTRAIADAAHPVARAIAKESA